MRFNHYLSKNEKSEKPQNILIIDTEANIKKINFRKQIHTFRLGSANYLQLVDDDYKITSYTYYSLEQFYKILDNLLRSKIRLYLVAHNMSYDYTILGIDDYLVSRNFDVEVFAIDSVFIVIARNQETQTTLTFYDSMNYWRTSLAEIGKMIHTEKMIQPDFYNVDNDSLMEYCQNDVLVLTNAILKYIDFIQKNDLGNFRLTIGSQALTSFRHRFMLENKLLIHTFQDILDMEVESYRGGRTEVFKLGKMNDIYKLDVNSMYPYVMHDERIPIKPLSNQLLDDYSIDDLRQNDNFALANCVIEINQQVIGKKIDGKLIFPIGKFQTVITNPEIRYILNHPEIGKIINLNKIVFYESEIIFKDYVDFFYNIKRNAETKVEEKMAKLFLNSLYGKFAQRQFFNPIEETERSWYILDAMERIESNRLLEMKVDSGEIENFISISGKVYKLLQPKGLGNNSIPIISSAITSYARIYLWELIYQAGLKNVFYCDTDSLFVNEQGLNNLKNHLNDEKLGMLKVEDFGNVNIRGVKDYSFNGINRIKGIGKKDIKIDENTFLQDHFITKKSKYQQTVSSGEIVVITIEKKLKRNYTKGIVENNGIVKPFVLCEV